MISKRVCVSVQAETVKDLVVAITKASRAATWVEVRADFLREKIQREHLHLMRKGSTGKLVFTCRSREEGGVFLWTEQERIALLGIAASTGFDLVDVEYHTFVHSPIAVPSKRLLLSHHDFLHTPSLSELHELLDAMKLHQPAVRKVATMVHDGDDLTMLLALMARRNEDIVVVGMGELGRTTRVLGPIFGAPFTYARLDQDRPIAPGNLAYSDVIGAWKLLGLTHLAS